MKTAGVVFNGIQFPFTLMDQAVLWARNNKANLHALFLISDDLGLADFNAADAVKGIDPYIKQEEAQKNTDTYLVHQRKLVEDTAAVEKIAWIYQEIFCKIEKATYLCSPLKNGRQ